MQNCNIKIIVALIVFSVMLEIQALAGVLDLSAIGTGARSLALGRTQVAAGDVGSVFINPAALAEFQTFSLTSMYSNLAEDTTYNMFGVVFPLKEGMYGCVGVGYLGAGVSGIWVTSSEARTQPISKTDYSNRLLILSYGRDINAFVQAGISAKILARSFDSIQAGSATGTDMDLGFLFYPKENITAGITLQNILNTQLQWKTGAIEDITSNLKFGVNIKTSKVLSVLADYDSSQSIHAGLEWTPKEFLAIRGGLENTPINSKESALSYSLGVGLALRGLVFDYAYYINSIIPENSSHFFSVSFLLPQKTVESRPIMPANIENPAVSFN